MSFAKNDHADVNGDDGLKMNFGSMDESFLRGGECADQIDARCAKDMINGRQCNDTLTDGDLIGSSAICCT